MAISNCLFSLLLKNSCGILSFVCICKFNCQPTQLLLAETDKVNF